MPDRTSKHRLTGVVVRAAGRHAGRSRLEDLDVLRSGATPRLFDDLRAPSTVGSWLRAFTCGHVRQLDAMWTPPSARPTGRPSRARRSATPWSGAPTRCWPPSASRARPARCCTPGCAGATRLPARAADTSSLRRGNAAQVLELVVN